MKLKQQKHKRLLSEYHVNPAFAFVWFNSTTKRTDN